MAQRTLVQLTDDLDGKPIADGEGETITFTYRGQAYEIDLSDKNLESLDKMLEKYLTSARKVSGGSGRRSGRPASRTSSSTDVDPKAVRVWAEANGIQVSPRGRLKADIVEQFKAAGN
jgi:hypothetical protein